jgi:hypothetical protein
MIGRWTFSKDCCNLNLYVDGNHSVGWHADDESLFQGPLAWIAMAPPRSLLFAIFLRLHCFICKLGKLSLEVVPSINIRQQSSTWPSLHVIKTMVRVISHHPLQHHAYH